MINITEYENYFENIVAINNRINGFEKLDLHDVSSAIDNMREKSVKTVLLVETYAVGKSARNKDQVFDTPAGAFLIMQKIENPRGDKKKQRDDILKETEQIANQVEARMKYDFDNENSFLADLELTSFTREKIGPDLDNRWGWRVMFRFKTYNPMQLIPSDWTDL